MKEEKGFHWNTCKDCQGHGKIQSEISRRRRRRYQKELDAFKSNNKKGTVPKYPEKDSDICLHCVGTGLIKTDKSVEINQHYPKIAIIGGGIGGAALAVACLHRGIAFTLYERDGTVNDRSQGYGLTLQQASKAIQGLGIESLLDGVTSTRHVVHKTDGTVIGEWGMRKWKQEHDENSTKRKNVHIARQSLRAQLLEQLPDNESIKWGHKLVDLKENKNGGIDFTFQVGNEIIHENADLIVGADGIRSVVREQVIGEDKTPLQYLGCMVMLGICPLKVVQGLESDLLDSATVFQTVNGHERIYMMPYDEKTIMWQLSFPMREEDAQALSKSGPQEMKKEALRRLQKWHDPISQILTVTLESDITGYPVYDRKLLDTEDLQSAGNVTLIGDAAHPMSPFKGQGANQALLDALVLARAISVKCGLGSQWQKKGLRETVLNGFEREMCQRTASKVTDSAKAVELLHSDVVLREGDGPRGRGV